MELVVKLTIKSRRLLKTENNSFYYKFDQLLIYSKVFVKCLSYIGAWLTQWVSGLGVYKVA